MPNKYYKGTGEESKRISIERIKEFDEHESAAEFHERTVKHHRRTTIHYYESIIDTLLIIFGIGWLICTTEFLSKPLVAIDTQMH